MNFIKAYKERVEDIPKYIDDYEAYLLDEFACEFVKQAINDYFDKRGEKNKEIKYSIDKIWNFFESKGYRKLDDIKQALLHDIRVLGFKVEAGHIIANPQELIAGYYDYLNIDQEIPENIDDYAFYLFDVFIKEFIPRLIKAYNDKDIKNDQKLKYPINNVWNFFQIKGYKKLESVKPIILKDIRRLGFDIEGSYIGYIIIDYNTLINIYHDYFMIAETKLSDLGLKRQEEDLFLNDFLIPAPIKPEKIQHEELKTSNPLKVSVEELSEAEKISNYTFEIFEREIIYKMLPQMIDTNSLNNIITICYSVYENYAIFNGVRFEGINVIEFTDYIASLPTDSFEKNGNTIKLSYDKQALYNFYYGERQNIEMQEKTR